MVSEIGAGFMWTREVEVFYFLGIPVDTLVASREMASTRLAEA